MKAALCFALVLLIVSVVNADSTARPCAGYPRYPNLELGMNHVKGLCALVECKESGVVEIHRCASILVEAGSIIIPEDPSKPHPECCEHAIRREDVNKN